MNNYGIEDWGMIVILDEMNDRIDLLEIEMKKNITNLSDEIVILKERIENNQIPFIEDNAFKIIIAMIAGITICISLCQILIFYTSYLESKKEERRRVMVEQRKP